MDYLLLGKRVRIRRNVLGITQARLAEMINVSTPFIGHIEHGTRKISVETLYKLCKALDTSADFLIGIMYAQTNPYVHDNNTGVKKLHP